MLITDKLLLQCAVPLFTRNVLAKAGIVGLNANDLDFVFNGLSQEVVNLGIVDLPHSHLVIDGMHVIKKIMGPYVVLDKEQHLFKISDYKGNRLFKYLGNRTYDCADYDSNGQLETLSECIFDKNHKLIGLTKWNDEGEMVSDVIFNKWSNDGVLKQLIRTDKINGEESTARYLPNGAMISQAAITNAGDTIVGVRKIDSLSCEYIGDGLARVYDSFDGFNYHLWDDKAEPAKGEYYEFVMDEPDSLLHIKLDGQTLLKISKRQ